MKVLIIQPPLIQLNTAYPSGAYLYSFFKKLNHQVKWYDLSIELFYKIFSKEGLTKLFSLTESSAIKLADKAKKSGDYNTSSNILSYLSQSQSWINWIDTIVKILTDGTSSSSRELCHRFIFSPDVPRGMRMNNFLENLEHEATIDDSRFLATMALADLGDYITAVFDKEFSLIRYGESLAINETSFNQIEKGITSPLLTNFYEEVLNDLFFNKEKNTYSLQKAFEQNPSLGLQENTDEKTLVCITVPFAGTFSAALYTGKYLKSHFSNRLFISAGGGFINTELRECNERSLANYFDALSYDRGYGSYLDLFSSQLLNKENSTADTTNNRSFYKLKLFLSDRIIEHTEVSSDLQKLEDDYTANLTPDFTDVDFSKYPRVCDDTNPMQRMWSDGSWLKAYLAHGCYWHRCAFCDTSLDYVKSYKPANIEPLFKSLKSQCEQKKVFGIHFVDEALPPKALYEFAKLNACNENKLSFWGNVRFEKTYTRDLADLLSYGGLLGVSGGIEIATGSGLNEINKGTDLDSIVSACCAFKEAGILVHAYMIYGYWQQSDLDTINSMETLRQMYAAGLLDSSFWHKFVLTRHSQVYNEWKQGLHPDLKPIEIKNSGIFAKNGLHFEDEEKSQKFSQGLNLALQNWMHGEGLNKSVGKWFNFKTPLPTIKANLIENSIKLYEEKRNKKFTQEIDLQKTFWLAGKILYSSGRFIWNYKGELIEKKIPDSLKNIFNQSITPQSFSSAIWNLSPAISDYKPLYYILEKAPELNKLLSLFRGQGLCAL